MSVRDLIPWSRQSSTAPIAYSTPDNSIAGFRREVDRLFEEFFRGDLPLFGRPVATWPKIEVRESDGELRITAELPGLGERDIELLIEDGALVIRGEKKSEAQDRDRGYSEFHYGRFERRIALPSAVDEASAEASFKNGVLVVTLPRSAQAERGRRIPIRGDTRH